MSRFKLRKSISRTKSPIRCPIRNHRLKLCRLCLNLLPNLKVLVLANNQIGRFPGAQVAKELQALQILDLSNNLIEELDDIADMNLPNLRVLDYQGNFVCTYLQRITQIQQLLCPKRYEKYNPVKIFTASYNQLPVGKLTEAAYI